MLITSRGGRQGICNLTHSCCCEASISVAPKIVREQVVIQREWTLGTTTCDLRGQRFTGLLATSTQLASLSGANGAPELVVLMRRHPS